MDFDIRKFDFTDSRSNTVDCEHISLGVMDCLENVFICRLFTTPSLICLHTALMQPDLSDEEVAKVETKRQKVLFCLISFEGIFSCTFSPDFRICGCTVRCGSVGLSRMRIYVCLPGIFKF